MREKLQPLASHRYPKWKNFQNAWRFPDQELNQKTCALWWYPTSWSPTSHLLQDLESIEPALQAQQPVGGFNFFFFCKSKTARLMPKRPHFELPTGKGNTLGPRTLGPISLRPSKQEVKKGYNKGDSGPHLVSAHTQSCRLYQARESWHSYTDCSPQPHETDSYLIRNYTLLETNWDRLRWEV